MFKSKQYVSSNATLRLSGFRIIPQHGKPPLNICSLVYERTIEPGRKEPWKFDFIIRSADVVKETKNFLVDSDTSPQIVDCKLSWQYQRKGQLWKPICNCWDIEPSQKQETDCVIACQFNGKILKRYPHDEERGNLYLLDITAQATFPVRFFMTTGKRDIMIGDTVCGTGALRKYQMKIPQEDMDGEFLMIDLWDILWLNGECME